MHRDPPDMLHRAIHLGLCSAALVLLSCTAPPPDGGLSSRQWETLLKRSQPPGELGIHLVPVQGDRVGIRTETRLTGASSETRHMLRGYRVETIHLPVIRVRVNGKVVYALVDTAAERTSIGYHSAKRANLALVQNPKAATNAPFAEQVIQSPSLGTDGPSDYLLGVAQTLAIGDLTVQNMPVWVLDDHRGLMETGWVDGLRIGMILGTDLWRRMASLTLDFAGEEVSMRTLDAPVRPRAARGRALAELPLQLKYAVPVVPAQWRGHNLRVALDSGSTFGLWMPTGLADDMGLQADAQDLEKMKSGVGAGGTTLYTQAGRGPLKLGPLTIRGVGAYVSVLDFGARNPDFALLGNPILRQYRTEFDFRQGTVRFYPPGKQ